MKNSLNLLFAIALFALVFSCDNINHDLVQQYNESLSLFNREKANHPAYEFTLSSSSVEGNFIIQTTFLVENNKVLKRVYKEQKMDMNPNGKRTLVDNWEEVGEQLNSHPNGHQVVTLEEIYENALSLIKVDSSLNYIYFEADKVGIVRHAGHVPKNCADDCFRGYTLQSFRWVDDIQAALAPSLPTEPTTIKILNPELAQKLQTSQTLFNTEKSQHKGYQFSLSFESSEGTFGYTTTFLVENGNLLSRSYNGFKFDREGKKEVSDKNWEETANEIGSHQQGHPPITLEDIYAALPHLIQVDSSQNHIYFEAKHDGIVSKGGHTSKACADDCFEGYYISAFEWIE